MRATLVRLGLRWSVEAELFGLEVVVSMARITCPHIHIYTYILVYTRMYTDTL